MSRSFALGTFEFNAVGIWSCATILFISFHESSNAFIRAIFPGSLNGRMEVLGGIPKISNVETRPRGPAVLLSAFTAKADFVRC